MSRLHVYVLLDHDTNAIVATAASLVGLGTQILAVGCTSALPDGRPATLDALTAHLSDEASVVLTPVDGSSAPVRIERHLLLP